MAALADFERFILPFMSNVPIPAVHDAVLDACIDYCTRTRLLRDMVEPITLVKGVDEYEIDPPDGDNQITEVIAAWLPEGQLYPATRPELDALYPKGWFDLRVGSTYEVRHFYCRQPGLIRLVPSVNNKISRALRLEVAYAPTRTAREVSDILLNRYAEKIATGALAKLHQHNAEYADPNRAVIYMQQFESYCNELADESSHGFSHQPLRTARDDL